MKYEHIRTYRQRADADGLQTIQATTKMEIIHYLLDEIEELRQYIKTNESKPLTDAEISLLRDRVMDSDDPTFTSFTRAIERAHGIGSEG